MYVSRLRDSGEERESKRAQGDRTTVGVVDSALSKNWAIGEGEAPNGGSSSSEFHEQEIHA